MTTEQILKLSGLYDKFVAAGCKIGNWQSDMYVRADDVARKVLKDAGLEIDGHHIRTFLDCELKIWIDIPFAYTPYWEEFEEEIEEEIEEEMRSAKDVT